jgi:hypothetical protein
MLADEDADYADVHYALIVAKGEGLLWQISGAIDIFLEQAPASLIGKVRTGTASFTTPGYYWGL